MLIRARVLITMVMGALLWFAGGAPSASAAELDHILRELMHDIPEDERQEPGNTRWPETLSEAAQVADELGLDASAQADLLLHAGEAWLAVRQVESAQQWITAALSHAGMNEALRQRAGLALVAVWQLRLDDPDEPDPQLDDPLQRLQRHGDFGPLVHARALSLAGQLAMGQVGDDHTQALAYFDQSLELLAQEHPDHRVPVLSLRITAMERSGAQPGDIEAYLETLNDDPAVAIVREILYTGAQEMVGSPAPPLRAARQDNAAGEWDIQEHVGQPILVYFSASWSQAAREITPQIVRISDQFFDQITVVEVTLDNQDTLRNLADYRAVYGITHPVIGEGLGWDGTLDSQWHITAIPSVVVVDAAGRVAATQLIADTPEATRAQISQLLERLVQEARDHADEE
ncbi:MAG: TlpA family protein disulfide reductase [Planctomycetota bacterium]|nr:MAG: TlpA family protein disulfide reductase [Planctomycetota bacterium]